MSVQFHISSLRLSLCIGDSQLSRVIQLVKVVSAVFSLPALKCNFIGLQRVSSMMRQKAPLVTGKFGFWPQIQEILQTNV